MADQQVVVELKAKTTHLEKGFKRADKATKKFGKNLAKGMMVATAAITGVAVVLNKLLKTFTEYGLKIDKAAKVTGMAAEALQKWGYIAKQEHGSFDAVIKAFTMLSQRMVDAEQGLETYAREFREMGIDLRDAEGNLRSVNDVFLDMGTYVKNTTNQTEAMGHMGKLLGARYVKDLMPMLKLTTEQIDQLGKEAEELGVVLDTKTIKAIKKFDDQMTKMKEGFKGIIYQLGAALLPALNQLPALLASLAPLFEKVMGVVGNLLKTVIPFIQGILDPLMKLLMPLLDAIASALDQILEPLLKPLVKVVEIIVKILEPFFKLLEPILKTALAPIVASLERSAIFLDMLMTILEPIMAIVTPFVDILGTIYDIGGDLIKTVMQPVINLLTRLSDKLKVFVDKIMPKFTHIVTTVKSVIEDTIIVIRDKLLGFINWVVEKINLLGFKLKTIKTEFEEAKPAEVIEREKKLNEIMGRRGDIQKKLKDLQTPILQEALERNAEFQERLAEAERRRVALKEEDLELSKKQLALLSDVEYITEKDKDKDKDKAVVDKGDEDIIRIGVYAGWNVMDAIADAEQKQADIAALEEKYLGRTKAFWEDWIVTDEDKAKFEQGLQAIEARMERWANAIETTLGFLSNTFSKFWNTLFTLFFAKLAEAETAWGKFGASIVKSLTDLLKQVVEKVLVYGTILGTIVTILNAIVPGLGNVIMKILGMGGDWEGFEGGFGATFKKILGFGDVKGSKQAGGEIEETGLHRLHKGEWVIPKRLTEVLGSLVGLSPEGVTSRSLEERFNAFTSRITQGIQGIMQPAIAGGQPPIHVHISGSLYKFIEGVEVSSGDEQQRLGRVVRIATAKDKEAD